MQTLPFVFSNQTRWKLARHGTFWLSWFLFQMVLYSFSPSPVLQGQPFWIRIAMTLPESFIYLLPHLFLAYTLMYIVIPKLVLPGKYFKAALLTCILFMITAGLSAILSVTIIEQIRQFYARLLPAPTAYILIPPLYARIGMAVLAGLRGSITIGGLAAAIKLMKCFYEKQQAALILEREKVSAELQMLKAQLHPHFLFNTLNNIYAQTQEVSTIASSMIFGLSALLRYMLYDCNQPLVPLEKELKMISDYIVLEKARYDDHLDLSVSFPEQCNRLQIAPLLLLPLVENAFKHGASRMINDPWISLQVELKDDQLAVKLINGKINVVKEASPGIGLANVQKRLELLYAGNYEFDCVAEEEVYIVNMKLKLTAAAILPSAINQKHEPGKEIEMLDR